MTFLDQGVTYLSSRAKRPPPPPSPHHLPTLQPLDKEIFVVFMRVRQFIFLMYLIGVYVCTYTIIRDQPHDYPRSAPTIIIQPQEAKMFRTKKQWKKTEKCYEQG